MKIKEMRSNKTWAPFGFINDGMDDEYFADAQGDVKSRSMGINPICGSLGNVSKI